MWGDPHAPTRALLYLCFPQSVPVGATAAVRFLFLGVAVFSVSVVSVRSFGWLGVEYVGRGRGSVLGNPFVLGRDGDRKKVVQLYRSWLWAHVQRGEGVVWCELVRLVQLARCGELVLGCWCCPLTCHGDVIRSCVLWLASSGLV